MKKISITFLLGILLCSISIKSLSQQDQRIHASYIFAFGRDAISEELNYWLGRGNFSISQLMEFHKSAFTDYPSIHKGTIIRSYIDALGRNPSENEMKYWMNRVDNYTQLLNKHIQFLQSNSWENENLIKLSYETVLHRTPNAAEVNFWKKKGITPYFLLVSYLENYKNKNRNEAGKRNNINLQHPPSVTTVLLSAAITAEALKFIRDNGNTMSPYFIKQNGKNMIVAGRGDVEIELVN
jgi:hypothetical protein